MTLDGDYFRAVLGHFVSGVVIITSTDGDEPVGVTAQSFSSLSLDPPLVLFCAARTSTTWPRIKRAGQFCIHVLGDHQEDLCRAFATSGGQKFAGVEWERSPTGNPIFPGCVAYIDCRLGNVHDEGDHHVVIGEVLDLRLGDQADPLVFFKGGFRQLHQLQQQQ